MATRVYIDGVIHDERTAVVPVFDRGFLYGDSVYEVTRTAGGRPVDLTRHLDRLDRSAAGILLGPPPRRAIEEAVRKTIAEAANPEAYTRIVLTRGAGEMGLDPALADRVRLIVIVRPLHLPAELLYREGVSVAIVAVRRNLRRAVDPAVKSGNYLNNILAIAEAKRAGAYESVMCNSEGKLVEGSSSNIFLVRGGRLSTPALEDGLLDGITRRRIIELATEDGLAMAEPHLEPGDLRAADEAFLTSSIRGVMPVVRVDGEAVGAGRPGPITRRLMTLYDRFLACVAEGTVE